jgi:Cu/Zn superoxide dismutase
MDKRSISVVRRGLAGALALAALVAVVVGASPAGADTSVGRFSTLAAGTSLGLEVGGVAVLTRTDSGTIGRIVVWGLDLRVTYAAHLHNQPCSAPNPGGGHYQDVVGGGATPPNELWFSSTSDPMAGITASRAGVATGRGAAEWVARPDARAVVIHAIPAGGSTAGGPKIACADL